ncbi:hypothetical protein N9517_02485 [Candidatus Pelagibacter sp.]|nr:hypothetical protein [Candidatus Pelagibacter sp.]
MKKLFIFLFLNLFLINYSLANVPSLGLANYGFVCNAEKGPAKAKKGVKNLGFVDEEGLFFYLMYIEEDNEFAIIENSPLQLGDISDNKYKLKDVIIWYDFFMMGDSIMPIFSPKTFFYDENKKNYYLIDNMFKLEKKFHKKVKRHDKILRRQFDGNLSTKLLNKMQKDYRKINNEIFTSVSKIYGSPISAEKIMKLHTAAKSNLYLCNKIE